jgi:hypothetical protein
MILESLVGLSLTLAVSVKTGTEPSIGGTAAAMSSQQKSAIMQPLVRAATECVLHAVSRDPRSHSPSATTDLRDLIVASMPSCADPMRAMIDAHDQLYGDGSGEVFFMGPYLDSLPTTIINAVRTTDR